MTNKRKIHTPEFKTKVSIAAIKALKTSSELASQYQIHPVQISAWKKQAIESMPETFRRGKLQKQKSEDELTAPLYEEIGRLKIELDWLKKSVPSSVRCKRMLLEPHHHALSIVRQCQLIGLTRSQYYYRPREESPENLAYLRIIDEQYLRTPQNDD